MFKGTFDGSRVCIKRIRAYVQEGSEKAAKVRYRRRRFPRLPPLTKPTDLLPRGHNVEILDTPKHCAPTGCQYYSLPTHFELDVWRRPAGIHQGEPRCRSTQTRRRPPVMMFISCLPPLLVIRHR